MRHEAGLPLMLRLWREQLRPQWPRLCGIAALTLAMAGLTGLYPLVIKQAFSLFEARDPRILYQVPVLVLSLCLAKAAVQYAQNVMVQHMALLAVRGLQTRMFAALTRADLARLERESPAALVSRFTTDATVIRDTLVRAVNGVADSLTAVGLVAAMLWLDPVLSLVAALLYPLAAVPIQRIGKRVRRASGGMQDRTGEIMALLHESFAQGRAVRAYRLEAMQMRRAEVGFARLTRALLAMARNRARVDPVMEVLGGGAVALVIGFCGWRASRGESSVGDFTGFVSALLFAARPLRALGSLNAAMQEGLAGLARVFAATDEKPLVLERADAAPLPEGGGAIRFEEVGFCYPDGRPGLSGLSFSAEAGQTVALVGASGAGKSTALALVPRLHDPASGRITLDGADLRSLSFAALRGAIAYVGQDPSLFDDTVAANIRMGRPGAGPEDVAAAAASAAAADFVAALPQGMETPVGPGGLRLSGGQRQRIALARALLRAPRVLLLDEATSALDAQSEAAVQSALATLRRGRTTIVVAHRLSTVRDADLVVVMEAGRAVEQGTHEQLLRRDGAYARLVRAQAFAA